MVCMVFQGVREMRTGARSIEGTFPIIFPGGKEISLGYFLHSLGLHGDQRPAITACLRLFTSVSLALSFLWCQWGGGNQFLTPKGLGWGEKGNMGLG